MDDLSVIGISKSNFINFLGNAGARSLGELAPSLSVADPDLQIRGRGAVIQTLR